MPKDNNKLKLRIYNTKSLEEMDVDEWIKKRVESGEIEGGGLTKIESITTLAFKSAGNDIFLNLTPFIEVGKKYNVMKIGKTILIEPKE